MSQPDMTLRRRDRLVGRFRREKVDALLVTNVHNVRYLSGFRGEDSALLVTRGRTFLLTDARFTEQAEAETRGLRIITRKQGMMRAAGVAALKAEAGRLGVEAENMTLTQEKELRKWARHMEVRQTCGMVERLRMVKDATEIAAIRRAAGIAEEAFRLILPQVRPGKTERELALALERAMVDLGADAPAFPAIVAAGERSSMPHAVPTGRRIRSGDAVLFDWGARWQFYHSDLTRVVFLDRIPAIFQRLYPVVLAAQRRALASVRPGRGVRAIDTVARAYLKAHRHGKHFAHGLGHGVGLEIHEAPGLSPRQDYRLKAGMVITIEPGVYVPGQGGVRIEDLVLVTRNGHEVLTSTQKSPELVLSGP